MIYLPSIYTVIDQQKNYYCAASCVKSTFNYINGSSESLSAIYANLQGTGQIQPGVALSRIAPYLNEEQNETVYATRDYTISYENMRIQLTAAINQYHMISERNAPNATKLMIQGAKNEKSIRFIAR